MKDYYAVLGLERGCSHDEIKQAYRRLSRQNHPDLVGHSPEAEERFKQINAAYEVLSNREKRELFDMGVDPLAPGGGGGAGANPFGFASSSSFGAFGDIFETLFTAAAGGTGHNGPAGRRAKGRDTLERLSIDLSDAVFGLTRQVTLSTFLACEACRATCCAEGASPQVCGGCQGRGATERIVRSMLGNMRTAEVCRQCQGYGDIIHQPCPQCSGQGRVRGEKTVEITIPAGVDTGNRLRLAGQGEAGPGGGPNGDLYVDVKVKAHPDFSRQGDDLVCTLRLPMTAAALGATLQIETFDGQQSITVPAGTQPGATIALDGLGVGRLRGRGRGDLKVVLAVEVPTGLDEDQAGLLRDLAQRRGEERPEAILTNSGSFFSRLKDAFQSK
ncbi:MAG: molecular chaperone DnaJ [Micrococcales bacterium]|nr:molecular chaperone DnaJ [Micrococcales bacterium]